MDTYDACSMKRAAYFAHEESSLSRMMIAVRSSAHERQPQHTNRGKRLSKAETAKEARGGDCMPDVVLVPAAPRELLGVSFTPDPWCTLTQGVTCDKPITGKSREPVLCRISKSSGSSRPSVAGATMPPPVSGPPWLGGEWRRFSCESVRRCAIAMPSAAGTANAAAPRGPATRGSKR